MKSEDRYRKLAKERQRAALLWRDKRQAQAALARASVRLLRWRKVDHEHATRALVWANEAISSHCKNDH